MKTKRWTANDVREAYLSFFEKRGHVRVPSAPLVPENDPSTLFTGSGMQPMVPYLLGEPHALGTRIVNSQKAFRVNDIEEVGDNRHMTFFEMLGNWSLGDYFKAEQIEWVFAFLIQDLGLDPNRLYVTVFRGNEEIGVPRDEESVKVWQKMFKNAQIDAKVVDYPERDGMKNGRIFYYDETKNWWSRSGVPANMPEGEPGGPDSEMFWDFGAERKLHETSAWKDQPCHVNCDCGRFLEIGNNVFMEYQKTKSGFERLAQKNVDFGGGLERILAALNDDPDVFRIEVFDEARVVLEKMSGQKYAPSPTPAGGGDSPSGKGRKENQHAFRVILDHIRAAMFLIADGVLPGTKDQGYFVRRLVRRAVRYAQHLGITHNFTAEVVNAFSENYRSAYPALANKLMVIREALTQEEEKFRRTLLAGLREFERVATGKEVLSAETIFNLYQSFGFPMEMTEEMASERNLMIDREGFQQLFEVHQAKSRAGSEKKFKGGLADHSVQSTRYHTATHLLHQALRTVLGDQVMQRGSNITAERLRFDFSHPTKLMPEEISQVERLVNEQIQANLAVMREEMTVDEARARGALGLFGHKYGERVSVYTMGNFSCEICGGPHVQNTGELGAFKIVKEEAASAGVRRIKAILE